MKAKKISVWKRCNEMNGIQKEKKVIANCNNNTTGNKTMKKEMTDRYEINFLSVNVICSEYCAVGT